MKLPRFPIRKSLIPYDDLGIQEVSGDNQVLGDDIGITLAPAIGLGPTGARVLQVDNDGRLFVNVDKLQAFSPNGKIITIWELVNAIVGDFSPVFDLSQYSYVDFYMRTVEDNSTASGNIIHMQFMDAHNNWIIESPYSGAYDNHTVKIGCGIINYGPILTTKNRVIISAVPTETHWNGYIDAICM